MSKPTSNAFANAEVFKVSAKKAAAKNEKAEYAVLGMENYAIVDAAEKNFKALKVTEKAELEPKVRKIFFGSNKPGVPESIRAVEGQAKVTCYVAKKTDNTRLTEEQVAALQADGIPVGKKVIIPEQYIFNPALIADPKVQEKITKALVALKIDVSELIQKQEEVSYPVVSDDTMAAAFKDLSLAQKHFDTIATIGFKPALSDSVDQSTVFKRAQKLVGG